MPITLAPILAFAITNGEFVVHVNGRADHEYSFERAHFVGTNVQWFQADSTECLYDNAPIVLRETFFSDRRVLIYRVREAECRNARSTPKNRRRPD